MTDWQPIETAPKGEYVLVYCPDAADWAQIQICGLLEFKGDPDPPVWWSIDADNYPNPLEVTPTHWMRWPEPPEAVG